MSTSDLRMAKQECFRVFSYTGVQKGSIAIELLLIYEFKYLQSFCFHSGTV